MRQLRFELDDQLHRDLRKVGLDRDMTLPQILTAAVRLVLAVPKDQPLPGEEDRKCLKE